MAIIDPDGLFSGERLAACSDLAQLYWPRFFLAANGCARLELSYKSLVSSVFRNFQKIPEPSEIWGIFREYEANFLAVLYESADGGWWCQFITSEKYLPKYKKTRDNMSPAPTFEQMENSRKGYLEWKKANSLSNQSFQKLPESFSSEGEERRGVGIGVGVVEKQKTAPLFELPDYVNAEAWQGFVEMRRKIPKVPFTDRARQGIVADLVKLHELGIDPNARLQKAVKSGWRGVLFDDDLKNAQTNGHAAPKPPSSYELQVQDQYKRIAQARADADKAAGRA